MEIELARDREREGIPELQVLTQQSQKKLEVLTQQSEKLSILKEKHEERIQKLEEKATNLTNFYAVFQGVILTAVSQGSSLKCKHWFIPFFLSLLASIINFIALVHTIIKYLRTREQLERNISNQEELRRQILLLRNGGTDVGRNQELTFDRIKALRRQVYFICTLGFFVIFGILVLTGWRIILCNHNKEIESC